jgi:leader peptidase (prepilin peptidase)/N-methyltransferase
LGPGDVRLAAALGAVLGTPNVLLALAAGILAGGVAALFLLATGRAGRRDRMAYAPYLALGAWLIWTRAFGLWPGS